MGRKLNKSKAQNYIDCDIAHFVTALSWQFFGDHTKIFEMNTTGPFS